MIGSVLERELGNTHVKFFADLRTQKCAWNVIWEHRLPALVLCRLLELSASRRKWILTKEDIIQGEPFPTVNWLALEKTIGRYLLAGTKEGHVLLYDVQTASKHKDKRNLHLPIEPMNLASVYHQEAVSTVLWYPVDPGIFLSASLDRKVLVWSSSGVEVVHEWSMDSRVHTLAMSELANHCLVAVGTESNVLRICDLNSLSSTHILIGHESAILAVNWSKTKPYELISGSVDGQLRLWDVRRSGSVHVFDVNYNLEAKTQTQHSSSDQSHKAHHGMINAVLPSPQGRYWISAGTDDKIQVWSTEDYTNQCITFPTAYNRARKPRQLSLSEDGKLLFQPSGSIIQVYEVETGELKTRLNAQMWSSIQCCVYNEDCMELYSGSSDQNIMVWEPQSESMDVDSWSER